jgi:hypothetical protein
MIEDKSDDTFKIDSKIQYPVVFSLYFIYNLFIDIGLYINTYKF